MRKTLALAVAFCFAAVPLAWAAAPGSPAAAFPQEQDQEQQSFEAYTADQLDNLLAPIALYPDPLLAQVLVAATFVDQIDEAARYVRARGQAGIDEQPWDVSVKAVAHYPTVLAMMADNLDWTAALGQAYVYQSTDVITSIQRLRAMANAQGNLVTTPQQQVIVEPGYIQIVPVGPRYIYIPMYDPAVIYFRRAYFPGFFTAVITFGRGWFIGAWLNLDFNWPLYRVYYTGWVGGGWIARCRPHVRLSRYYVDNRFRTIALNRRVIRRKLNVYGLNHFRSVHPRVTYQNRLRLPPPRAPAIGSTNKVINRNIDIHDPKLNEFRGRARPSQPAARIPVPSQPARPVARPPVRPRQPVKPPATKAPPRPAQPPRAQTAPAARQPGAFGAGAAVFTPKAASERGKASRSRQNVRPEPSKPARKQQPRRERRQP